MSVTRPVLPLIASDVRDGDFQRGINNAVANNWITVSLRNRYHFVLTPTGFAAARTILPTPQPVG